VLVDSCASVFAVAVAVTQRCRHDAARVTRKPRYLEQKVLEQEVAVGKTVTW
tara:strand:- start:5521 stop:5676 length:156 start_codon:yes stop_codon:yes gene_type:complete